MPGTKGRSGRRAKPTKQKQLAGNPGKRAVNKNEPEYDWISNVDVPDWMVDDDVAADAFRHYAPILCSQRVLTLADIHNLEAFCMAYSRWRSAEVQLADEGFLVYGDAGPKKNPVATVINESLRQLNSFGALLGLSPADRSRIKRPDSPHDNPFKNL